jgi:hypothetical protein
VWHPRQISVTERPQMTGSAGVLRDSVRIRVCPFPTGVKEAYRGSLFVRPGWLISPPRCGHAAAKSDANGQRRRPDGRSTLTQSARSGAQERSKKARCNLEQTRCSAALCALCVKKSKLVTTAGQPVELRSLNRPGTERARKFRCPGRGPELTERAANLTSASGSALTPTEPSPTMTTRRERVESWR